MTGINYGVRIEVEGKAAETLKKTAAASKELEVAASSAGKSLSRAFEFRGDNLKELPRIIKGQREAVRSLEAEYRRLQQVADKSAPGTPKMNASRNAFAAKNEWLTEKQTLLDLIATQERYGSSTETLRTRLMKLRQEMGALILAGKENSAEYRALQADMQRIGEADRKLRNQQIALSTGGTQWAGIASGIQGLIGLYGAATGAVGMFTKDNEKLAKVQQRLAQTFSIVIGLETAANTLHATSAFRITTVTTVTKAWRSAQQTLSAALWGSNLAAKAFMGTVTLGLSVGITAAIAGLSRYTEKQRKIQEELRKTREEQKRFNASVGETAADSIVKFKRLQVQWERLGESLKKRQEFIKQNKSEFESLGASINKVSDAEKLFTSGEGAFVQSLINRARAMAAITKATELLGKAVTASEERADAERSLSYWKSQQNLALQGDIRAGFRGDMSVDLAKKYLSGWSGISLRPNEELYLKSIVNISELRNSLVKAIHSESDASKRANNLIRNNISDTSPGAVSKDAYTPPKDPSSRLRGTNGTGGSRHVEITFNSPVVQIDGSKVDGKTYTPKEIGDIAAKEVVNILTQIAIQ